MGNGVWVPTCNHSPHCTANKVVDSFPVRRGCSSVSSQRALLDTRLFGFSPPNQRMYLHMICIHLHALSQGLGMTCEKHIFSHQDFILNQSSGAKRASFSTLPWPSPLLPNSSPHLRALTSSPTQQLTRWKPSSQGPSGPGALYPSVAWAGHFFFPMPAPVLE